MLEWTVKINVTQNWGLQVCSSDTFCLGHETNYLLISDVLMAQQSGQHIHSLHCPRKHVQETDAFWKGQVGSQQLTGFNATEMTWG